MSRPVPAREAAEEREGLILAPQAALARKARREVEEPPCPFRTSFQRDRDRIIHSKAFRRLAYKTQVFINPAGDHFRTRLTHTLEVSQIARTLARALRLNEDLTEAIALGHDLGHTPFGHQGERTLDRLCPIGFTHQAQSLRLVERLAKEGRGLNLTEEVRDGILKHSKGQGPIFANGGEDPATAEGRLTRAADIIAYLAHDLDDALRAGLLAPDDLPPELTAAFGSRGSARIRAMVGDLLSSSRLEEERLILAFSPAMEKNLAELRAFLQSRLYNNPELNESLAGGGRIIEELYNIFAGDRRLLLERYPLGARTEGPQAVCDFISGMTDRYALALWRRLGR